MTTIYDINYQFNFDTVSNYVNKDKLAAIDTDLTKQDELKSALPENFKRMDALKRIMEEKKRLNKAKADVTQSFIDSYAELRKLIIFPTLSDKKPDENILGQYIEYIKKEIPTAIKKIISGDYLSEFNELFAELFVNIKDDDELLKKINDTIESRKKKLPAILFHAYDLVSILITHILKMIYTICSIYTRIYIKKESNLKFVLLFCHGDYHTLKFKCKYNSDNYLMELITGNLPSLDDKNVNIDKTPSAIELSYDISNTALPMFTTLDDLSIFMELIGYKIHRICIISCLNYKSYKYTYEKNSKTVTVDEKNVNDYIDSIYITPIIPFLTESGELIIYGGNAHNVLGDRFNATFEHIADATHIAGGQLSVYKKIHNPIPKNIKGGNIFYRRKTRKRSTIASTHKSKRFLI